MYNILMSVLFITIQIYGALYEDSVIDYSRKTIIFLFVLLYLIIVIVPYFIGRKNLIVASNYSSIQIFNIVFVLLEVANRIT
jgi:hypothetical protein